MNGRRNSGRRRSRRPTQQWSAVGAGRRPALQASLGCRAGAVAGKDLRRQWLQANAKRPTRRRRAGNSGRRRWPRTPRRLQAQQQEMTRQGELLAQVVQATGDVIGLERTLNENLKALAGTKNFEDMVLSLTAAIHLLTTRLGVAPAASAGGSERSRTKGRGSMRRQRLHKPAVGMQLFPFLAVLICTMGALIVVLVLVVRHARGNAETIAEQRVQNRQEQPRNRGIGGGPAGAGGPRVAAGSPGPAAAGTDAATGASGGWS